MTVLLPYRFPAWAALTMFSLISLLSILDERRSVNGKKTWEFHEKWCLSLASISFAIGAIVSFLHCISTMRQKLIASSAEGALILIVVIIWVMAIPVIMGPNHDLAVSEDKIVDANLYFSGWMSFGLALYIFASFGREVGKLSYLHNGKWWLCLAISSLIAMTAAVRIFNNTHCDGREKVKCRDLRLGISLSIVSAFISVFLVAAPYILKDRALPSVAVLIAAIIVLVLWSILVAYLTFKNGPGSRVGNLFFAIWISFSLALYLVVSLLFATALASDGTTTTTSTPKSKEKKPNKPEQAV
jgi:hypothetical protein